MPVYEYACDCCGSQFEIRQGFNDPPVAFCPRCNAKVRRVFHVSPIIFKGEGFYVTENRPKEANAEPAPSDKPSSKPAVEKAGKPVAEKAGKPAETGSKS